MNCLKKLLQILPIVLAATQLAACVTTTQRQKELAS